MIVATESAAQSFVVLPIGEKRVALPAASVIELVAPVKVQSFPHATEWISGVLVRRNRVVPVCDVGQLFGESAAATSRLYLIAEWNDGSNRDWCAIPVCGECELTSASPDSMETGDLAVSHGRKAIAAIQAQGEEIELVDLAKLIEAHRRPNEQRAVESAP